MRSSGKPSPPGPRRGRPKAFTFSYRPESKAFNLKLSFSKGKADREDVIAALEAILSDLRNQR